MKEKKHRPNKYQREIKIKNETETYAEESKPREVLSYDWLGINI
jgi:hypothetical protein